jgi:hypothetical protein
MNFGSLLGFAYFVFFKGSGKKGGRRIRRRLDPNRLVPYYGPPNEHNFRGWRYHQAYNSKLPDSHWFGPKAFNNTNGTSYVETGMEIHMTGILDTAREFLEPLLGGAMNRVMGGQGEDWVKKFSDFVDWILMVLYFLLRIFSLLNQYFLSFVAVFSFFRCAFCLTGGGIYCFTHFAISSYHGFCICYIRINALKASEEEYKFWNVSVQFNKVFDDFKMKFGEVGTWTDKIGGQITGIGTWLGSAFNDIMLWPGEFVALAPKWALRNIGRI